MTVTAPFPCVVPSKVRGRFRIRGRADRVRRRRRVLPVRPGRAGVPGWVAASGGTHPVDGEALSVAHRGQRDDVESLHGAEVTGGCGRQVPREK
jgi:hypothetical protein